MERASTMNLLKNISLILLFCFSGISLAGQAARQETLQQQKVVFFNEKLQLTPAEAAKFWPVYNDYQNRHDKITRDRNNLLAYFESNKNNMSEAEAAESIRKFLACQQDETKLLETYTLKFQEFLPKKKVMMIYSVEQEFKKWLLAHLRQNKVPVGTK